MREILVQNPRNSVSPSSFTDFNNNLVRMSQTQTVVHTACPRSSDLFYIITYYIKWVTTSWTHSTSPNNY